MTADVVDLALACYRAPLAYLDRLNASAPLPEGMNRLLALANGAHDALEEAARHSDARPDELRDAARFLIQQLCGAHGAGYYRVLGLEPGAPLDEIKEHHRQLMRLYHPDRAAGCETWTVGYAARINEAWTQLSRPESRASYDAQLPRSGSQSSFRSAVPAVGARASTWLPGPLGGPGLRQADRPPWPRRTWLPRRLPMLVLGSSALVATLVVWAIHLAPAPPALLVYTPVATAITPRAPPPDLAASEAEAVRAREQWQRIAQRLTVEQRRMEGGRSQSAPAMPTPPAQPVVPQPTEPPSVSLVQRARAPLVAAPITRLSPAAAAITPASARTPDESSLTDRELKTLLDRYTGAYRRGDLNGLMALFAPDARGRDGGDRAAIRQVYGGQFAAFLVQRLDFHDLRSALHGDTASVVARYELWLRGRHNDQLSQVAGRIRLRLRKRDGQVLIGAIDYDRSGK